MTNETENKDVLHGVSDDQTEETSTETNEQSDSAEEADQTNEVEETSTDDEVPSEPKPPQAPEMSTPPPPPANEQTANVSGQAGVASDRDFGIFYKKVSNEMKKHLQNQPQVSFMIPKDPLETDGLAYASVQINGHRMEIKKGVMVTIPQQVAELLANKYNIEMSAGQDMQIDRDDTVRDALTR